jgi:hypothetical protein
MASSRWRDASHDSRNVGHFLKRQNYLSRRLATFTHNFSELRNEDQSEGDYHLTCLWIKSCFGLAHRSGKWAVAEIYRRTLDSVPFVVDNEAEAPVLMKERQPIASSVFINSTLAENRNLSFAHPNLNERRLDIEPSSDDSCIDAEGAFFKLHYGHGMRLQDATLLNFERQPFHTLRDIRYSGRS